MRTKSITSKLENFIFAAGVVAILFVTADIFFQTGRSDRIPATQVAASHEVTALHTALVQYFAEFGSAPVGSQAAIIKTLRGENPRQMVLLEVRGRSLSKSGEFLDPWKHPYRIDVSTPAKPAVYSFGPNGRDEGGIRKSDDVTSWR